MTPKLMCLSLLTFFSHKARCDEEEIGISRMMVVRKSKVYSSSSKIAKGWAFTYSCLLNTISLQATHKFIGGKFQYT